MENKHLFTPKYGFIHLAEHKTLEYQIETKKFYNDPFEFNISWTTKQDHAGFDFTFSIYKLFWLNLNIKDNRHWNYDQGRWNTEEDDIKQEEQARLDDHGD